MHTKLLPKQKGEWAEVCFAAEVLRRGWRISRPYGDSCPYDCIVDCGATGRRGSARSARRTLSRVQVKSVNRKSRSRVRCYPVNMVHGRRYHLRYSRREVDVIAVLIVPKHMWYIVPIGAVEGRGLLSFAGSERVSGGLEGYREAWEVLKPQPQRTRRSTEKF
jgi:PD-(D/E)XK endonuclease